MGKLREKLTPAMPWRWPLFCGGCLLSGLVLAAALRLICTQSIRLTLAGLGQRGLWMSALFLGLICAFLGLLTHSLFAGCLITFLCGYGLTLVNYYKLLITSTSLTLGDFSLIGQVGHIAKLNAEAITLQRNTVLALVGGVIWLAIALFFSKPLRIRWRWSLVGAAGSAAVFFLVFWLGAGPLVYGPMDLALKRTVPQTTVNETCSGPALGLWRTMLQTANRDLGENYSQERIDQVVSEVERYSAGQPVSSGAGSPNIILILSESFFDVTRLDNVTYPQDPIPEFHALQAESVSGSFYTRSLGYGTCNIELEVFTGVNTGIMSGEDLYGWDPQVFSRLPTVVSLLKEQGYTTDMLHMFNDTIYHRAGFFRQLGFDNLYFSDNFAEFYPPAAQAEDYWGYMRQRIAGRFYSDDLMTDGLIALYEKRSAESDAPVFLYGISMENHSTYTDGKYPPEQLTVDPQSELTGEAAENLLYFSQGVSNASAALGKLVDYFRTVDEPTIIVFYGDHRPGLGLSEGGTVYSALGEASSPWTAEEALELYSTDYLIWANDPALLPGEAGSTADVSCNYMGTVLLDLAGAEKPLFWRFLSQLSETRMADTPDYHLGRDGSFSFAPLEEGEDAYWLGLLTELLNDTIYGKGYGLDKIG